MEASTGARLLAHAGTEERGTQEIVAAHPSKFPTSSDEKRKVNAPVELVAVKVPGELEPE